MTKSILVTGAQGFLGRALVSRLSTKYSVRGTHRTSSATCDKFELGKDRPSELPLDWDRLSAMVLCAGITSKETCRQDPSHARRVNVDATVELADYATRRGVHTVFVSSDAVFHQSHRDQAAPSENEPPSPATVYGTLKLEAEKQILQMRGVTVLRLTKVTGVRNDEGGFLPATAKQLLENQRIRATSGQRLSLTSLEDVTAAVEHIVERGTAGLYHLGPKETLTRFQWCQKLSGALCLPAGQVEDVAVQQLRLEEPLSLNASLDGTRLSSLLNMSPLEPDSLIGLVAQRYSGDATSGSR